MNDGQKELNPYKSPLAADAKPARGGFRISFAFVIAMLLTGLLPAAIFLSRGAALQVFDDFDVELPVLTRVAVSWGFLALACGLFLFTLVKEFVLPPVMSTRIFNSLASLSAVVLGAMYGFCIFLPLVSLIQNLA